MLRSTALHGTGGVPKSCIVTQYLGSEPESMYSPASGVWVWCVGCGVWCVGVCVVCVCVCECVYVCVCVGVCVVFV